MELNKHEGRKLRGAPWGHGFRGMRWFLALGIWVLAFTAFGVETKVLRDDSFADLSRGETTGTEILAEGKIRMGPLPKRLVKTDDALAWKVALDRYDKNIFFATGHEGKVWRLDEKNQLEVWADLDEVEATAITVDATGGVLVGASPSGKIYRIVKAGKPELFFETKELYIWDLIFDREGVLYAATGPNGKIFRIRGPNDGEVYYDTPATNVMGLAFDSQGTLLAATQGKGYVFRIPKANQGTVLYAATEDECRALTVDHDGNIYVAINSARVASVLEKLREERASAQAAAQTQSPNQQPAGRPDAVREALAAMTASLASLGGQSTVVRIEPSGFASTFWNATDAPIHALVADPAGQGIYVAAGSGGKIYRLMGDTNYSLVADVEEQSALSFTSHNGQLYFACVTRAAIYALGERQTTSALFASRPLNAGSIVAWGNFMLEAETPSDSKIEVEVRAGNTPDPADNTWGEWLKAKQVSDSHWSVGAIVGQYLQYRLRLTANSKGKSPVIDALQFFYVQRNAPPILKSVRVEKVGGEAPPPPTQPQPSSTASGAASSGAQRPDSPPARLGGALESLIAAATGARPEAPSQPQAAQPPAAALGAASNSNKFTVSWDATDPNGDKLVYEISLKGEDESNWKNLEKQFSATRYTLDTSSMADGLYRVRITASDRPQNPDDRASTTSLMSRVFAIDNTPPVISEFQAKKVGPNRWEIVAKASDALSMLASASYCIDLDTTWYALLPEDGIFDATSETFRFIVEPREKAEEHLLRLRVMDREGNARVAKILLR